MVRIKESATSRPTEKEKETGREGGRGAREGEGRKEGREGRGQRRLQGYLAHKEQPPPLGPPSDPRYSPTLSSQEGGVSYERGTPVACAVGSQHTTPDAPAS